MNTRFTVLSCVAAIALSSAACTRIESGDSGDVDNLTPTSESATASAPTPAEQEADVEPRGAELPDAVDVAELPATDDAQGLILGYQTESYGCTILTYADGVLSKRGTFEAPAAKNKPSLTGCGVRSQYTSDYGARVADSYANYVDANTYDRHVLVQEIDQAGRDVSGNETLFNPVVGPDDKVYVNHGGTPSVMSLDGTGLQKVPDGRPRPAWLGGKMVADRLRAVSNPDGSLAVEYLGQTRGYRVGTIEEGKSSGIGFSGVVINAGQETLMPLAWVGEDQFLTSSRGAIFLNRITTPEGDDKPSVSTESLTQLPEQYMASTNPVSKMVACKGTAYFTVPVGGTQGLPTKQSALLGVDLVSGELTAHASIQNAEAELGVTHDTDVVGCAN